ncbi:DNA ligase [Pleionea sp. CnH1-48]|uniref:DNA ligase n=1 Tax=Pleionea sp. CnH1-48 TaxID=2954494 RepID=UPI00209713C9|nr:DNA ligase [Pleionea sp. CnH1-48]MCO7223110.1 DNA ligase [Pleionea sp. CnH1-48]
MKTQILSLAIPLLLAAPAPILANAEPPPLQLANRYQANIDVTEYWMSEKLDGVRAYWDGHQLLSRSGKVIKAPIWFTEPLMAVPLDGELWIGRGHFDEVSAISRKQTASDIDWRQVKFMVFDAPAETGFYDSRLASLKHIVAQINSPHIRLVVQQKVVSKSALESYFQWILGQGGEGIMLRKNRSNYEAKRSNDLLKLKTHSDAEATVIDYLPGKGQFAGLMGALIVEDSNGLRFKIGTGFDRQQRKTPPPIGTLITYEYQGKTPNGIPRFARFIRERNDL